MRTPGRAGWPETARPPAARVEEAPGQEDTLCFQLRFCDLSAKRGLQVKTSRAFSYFLAYSPGVHLNRNQLLAFSLLQHVARGRI